MPTADRTRDEAALDRYFKRKVEAAGALTYKGDRARGWPDYFVFWPEPDTIEAFRNRDRIELVELKDPHGVVLPMQDVVHDRLHSRGHTVHVLRGKDQVDKWLKLSGAI